MVPGTLPAQTFAHPNVMKVNELLELDVTDVALGGKALARHEGRAVFVDRGLPGDRVLARLTRVKRAWAEARLERVVGEEIDLDGFPARHDTVCGTQPIGASG